MYKVSGFECVFGLPFYKIIFKISELKATLDHLGLETSSKIHFLKLILDPTQLFIKF